MTDKQEFVVRLSNGYSTQAKTTNTFWLVLIIASIIALVGRIDKDNFIELPFTLGRVVQSDFYQISLILISIVTIAFSVGLTQTLRTRMLIQKSIEQLTGKEKYIGNIHIQDYVDGIATPTYTRVAPVPQFMLGKKQFLGEGKQNRFTRTVATVLYIILKLITFPFLYLIPIFGLKKCWTNWKIDSINAIMHIPIAFLIALTTLAAICMLILFIGEIKHIWRVSAKLLE